MAINNLQGLAHIGFFVRDMDQTKAFYCDGLGFRCVFETRMEEQIGTVRICFLVLGDLTFEAICVPGLHPPADGCFGHVAIRVHNIEQATEKLKALGVTPDPLVHSPAMFAHGAKWVNFTGPDGEHLELNEIL